MKKETNENGSYKSISSTKSQRSSSNSSLYCRIHDEEINWICFYKEGSSDNLCEHNLLCLYCRKDHNKNHIERIESIDFLKTDYLKKIIKKESDKIQNAKDLKVRLLELKAKINKLIDSKLESLNSINENYELDKCLEKIDRIHKKINNQTVNEINSSDIMFFDETLNLILSLKQDKNNLNGINKHSKSNNNSSTNSNSPINNSNLINNANLDSSYKRSLSLINNNNHLANSFIKEGKLSACTNEINFNLNSDSDNMKLPAATENFNFNSNSNLILEDLHEKIKRELDSLKRKSSINFNFSTEKFFWDEKILAENTLINKENDLITIKKSEIHNAAKSKQEFTSGFFSSKILIEEMSCCGGVGIGFDRFNPNGRRDVLFNNYIYFSDGKIAGNIKVENLPKFREGDMITIFCNIDLKEISFFLNSKSVYTIKNAEFKNEVYVLGDLDGGQLKFIS